MVYYRIDAGGREVIHTTFLNHDDGDAYEFRMVSADERRLVCVYEVTRASEAWSFLLIYDATTQKSWPRTSMEEGGTSERLPPNGETESVGSKQRTPSCRHPQYSRSSTARKSCQKLSSRLIGCACAI